MKDFNGIYYNINNKFDYSKYKLYKGDEIMYTFNVDDQVLAKYDATASAKIG
jgi:hypothetical protein